MYTYLHSHIKNRFGELQFLVLLLPALRIRCAVSRTFGGDFFQAVAHLAEDVRDCLSLRSPNEYRVRRVL